MPKYDPQKHHRQSIRLQGYDYASAGGYFVTVVTWHRETLFGEIANREMRLNKVGKIVEWEWLELPKRLPYISLGAYVVMPNHFHGILFIHENVGATRQDPIRPWSDAGPSQTITTVSTDGSPLRQTITNENTNGSPLRPNGPKPSSLGAILAQFKSRVTKRIWKIPEFKGMPIWQRNYYEHILRNHKDLESKTNYILANPLLWEPDDENPNRQE